MEMDAAKERKKTELRRTCTEVKMLRDVAHVTSDGNRFPTRMPHLHPQLPQHPADFFQPGYFCSGHCREQGATFNQANIRCFRETRRRMRRGEATPNHKRSNTLKRERERERDEEAKDALGQTFGSAFAVRLSRGGIVTVPRLRKKAEANVKSRGRPPHARQ